MNERVKKLFFQPLKQEKKYSDGLVEEFERIAGIVEDGVEDGTGVPGLAAATARVTAAILLTSEVEIKGIKFKKLGDQLQKKVFDATNNLQQKWGLPGEILIPTYNNIESMFLDVDEAFEREIPQDVPTYYELKEIMAQEAKQHVRRIESGDFDGPKIRKEEKVIATHILKEVGTKSAAELKATLDDYVYGRVLDTVAAEKNNRLARRDGEFKLATQNLRNFEPKKWIMVDYVTSWLMSRRERKEMQDLIWTVTPTELIVKNITQNVDVTRLALERFHPDDEAPIYVHNALTDIEDVLRSGSTRLFQRFTTSVIEEKLGGILILRDERRDEELAKLPVRAHIATRNILRRFGKDAHGYERTQGITDRAADEIDVSPRHEIRPNKIRESLPTNLIFEIDAELNPNGSVDWDKFVHEVDIRIESKKLMKLEETAKASYHLNENDEAPEEYMDLIYATDRQIQYLENEKVKLLKHLNQ